MGVSVRRAEPESGEGGAYPRGQRVPKRSSVGAGVWVAGSWRPGSCCPGFAILSGRSREKGISCLQAIYSGKVQGSWMWVEAILSSFPPSARAFSASGPVTSVAGNLYAIKPVGVFFAKTC